jgi:hypothetical protein
MKSLTSEEARAIFCAWQQDKSPVWVVFFWAEAETFDTFESCVAGLGDDWITLAAEGRKDIRLPLEGAIFKEGDPSEAPLEHRASSVGKYIRMLEILLPGPAKCWLFERKIQ